MRRAARVDDNQAEIVRVLRAAGCMVHSTASMGKGFPDLLVGYNGALFLLEVKDGNKSPSERNLTKDEQAFHDRWSGFPVFVVCNPLQALVAVGMELHV